MGISTRGTDGTRPYNFGQGEAISNAPPPNYWAQYLHYVIYSLSFPEQKCSLDLLYKFLLKLHKIAYRGLPVSYNTQI